MKSRSDVRPLLMAIICTTNKSEGSKDAAGALLSDRWLAVGGTGTTERRW